MKKIENKTIKMQLKKYVSLFLTLTVAHIAIAQIGVNTDAPDALLDIRSTNQGTPENNNGLLIPKMDNFPSVNPTVDQDGMIAYATGIGAAQQGFWYWNNGNNQWVRISGELDNVLQINAGDGLTSSITSAGFVTINAIARNGLQANSDEIVLGGSLDRNTSIALSSNDFNYNMNSTGEFSIDDDGVEKFKVQNDGNTIFGGDVEWRTESASGQLIANLINDGNDGAFVLYQDGNAQVVLDANSRFIFNEQGRNRDFRIESENLPNMFALDAEEDRISIGSNDNMGTFNVSGDSFFTNDLILLGGSGSLRSGVELVKISNPDTGSVKRAGVIEVSQILTPGEPHVSQTSHIIHGLASTVFNEQGNAAMDFRIESDSQSHMLYVDAADDFLGIATDNPTSTLTVNGTSEATKFKVSALNTAPASSTSPGETGEIRITTDYIYIYTGTRWKRVALDNSNW